MEKLRIRPYRSTDCEKIKTWITDEESHLKWCANTIPFGFSEEEFEISLQEGLEKSGEMGFTATDAAGVPVGFFKLSLNYEENAGFFKCIIVDGNRRGAGIGKQMLTGAVKYAFEIAGVEKVRLVVFDENPAAVSCYAKVGFEKEKNIESFAWNGRKWGRTRLLLQRRESV